MILRAVIFILAFGWLCDRLQQTGHKLQMKKTADIDRAKYEEYIRRNYLKGK